MRRPYRPIRRRGGLGYLLDSASLVTLAANAGFSGPDLATAVAIALAESGGDPGVIGDRTLAPTNGPSFGLWQINIGSKAHPEFAPGTQLLDPQANANAAYSVYSRRGGFSEWATYTSGAYLQFLPQVLSATTTPLTIDATTGQPIDDSTPTPPLGIPGQITAPSGPSGTSIVGALAAGVALYLLADVLS